MKYNVPLEANIFLSVVFESFVASLLLQSSFSLQSCVRYLLLHPIVLQLSVLMDISFFVPASTEKSFLESKMHLSKN